MKNGQFFYDTNNQHINAHGGCFLKHEGIWYWYGEHKTEGFDGRFAWKYGVHVYSSTDLANWTDHGCALALVDDDPESPILRGERVERPKVIYCEKTGKFVMYFHSANKDHSRADMGVAVSDTPIGPFEFLYAERAEKGVWPMDVTRRDQDPKRIAECPTWEDRTPDWRYRIEQSAIVGRDFERGQGVRDQTLFVDDDGKAYHFYTSGDNSTIHIAELTDDFLHHTGKYTRMAQGRWQEAPVIFKHNNIYYMLTSGCTGFLPNAAHGLWAENIWGPWFEFDNPCRGEDLATDAGPELTWNCQGACGFFSGGKQYVVFDRWNMKNFSDSQYVWLPVEFHDNRTFTITWQDECVPELD